MFDYCITDLILYIPVHREMAITTIYVKLITILCFELGCKRLIDMPELAIIVFEGGRHMMPHGQGGCYVLASSSLLYEYFSNSSVSCISQHVNLSELFNVSSN